jgi:uncharacterized protein with PIN domain
VIREQLPDATIETAKRKSPSASPPNVRNRHVHFVRCIGCDQVYWRGSHVERILAELSDVIAA